jgi:protein CpxP
MKSKFGMIAAALLAVVLCGAAVFAYAQQNDEAAGAGWGGHRHGRMERIAKELNLTDAQKAQIKTMMQAQRTTLRPLMQQMATNRKAMLTATSNGTFNQAQVQTVANQQAQLMAQLTVQRESLKHDIYTQVLTPDQRAKADQMRAKQLERIDQRLQKLSEPAAPPSGQ